MASNPSRRPAIPSKDASPSECKRFLDSVIDYSSAYRIRLFRKLERARLYRQSDQWIEPDFSGYADPLMTPFWKPMEFDASNWQPTPVQNEVFPAIKHETARLVSVGSNPYIRPSAPEPRYERAAKLGKEALLDRLEKVHWHETEYAGTLNCTTFGTAIWKSGWEIDRRKTVPLPLDTAVKCPQCDFRLATPTLPPGKLIGLQGKGLGDRLSVHTLPPREPGDVGHLHVAVKQCLQCGAPMAPAGGPGLGEPEGFEEAEFAEEAVSASMGATMGGLPETVPSEPDDPNAPRPQRPDGMEAPGTSPPGGVDMTDPFMGTPGQSPESPTAPESAKSVPPAPGGASDLLPPLDASAQTPGSPLDAIPPTAAPPLPPVAPALVPYLPSESEAATGRDFFGRRLGEDIPLGDTFLRAVSPFDGFPQNQGLETTAESCEEWGESRVENLDWITACYENGYLVKSEAVEDIWRWHPIVGGSNVYFGGGAAADPRLFDNHARVKEWHKAPWFERDPKNPDAKPRLNRGRSIVMANGVVLLNADFMLESRNHPGELIPRVTYEYVPWELAHKEMFGVGMVELIASIQDTINTRRSQVIDARHRFGSPKILAEEGMDLQFAGFTDSGYNSDIYYYRPTPDGTPPTLFGNTQMSGEWTQEEDRDVAALQRILGITDADTGNLDLSKSPWAASAVMFMAEQSAKSRENTIERLRAAKRRLFRHQLLLMHEFYREDRFYSVRANNNRWDVKSFKGADLLGQCDVQLESEPAYNTRVFRREAIGDGLKMGLIDISSEVAKRRARDEMDIPQDIDEDKNVQVARAEEEWIRFTESLANSGDGTPPFTPVVSVRDDAHITHFQQHSLDWTGEQATRMKDAVGWRDVELALWGWEEKFDALEAMEADLKANPPGPEPPPPVPDAMGQVSPEAVQHTGQMWQQRVQMQQQIASMPKATELRLMMVWANLVQASGLLTMPGTAGQPDTARWQKLQPLLRFYAHKEAHYRIGQHQATAATGGVPMPAPPGAPETGTGLMPSSGAAGQGMPGSGSGPTATTSAGSAGTGGQS